MNGHLVLSFRFLAPWFHGRGDEGAPEWPPSPLRAFQAMVAAAGRAGTLDATSAALVRLEQAEAPQILAPEAHKPTGYRLSVPHNAMDLVARQWTRGDEGNPAEHRAMKNVRPHRLSDDAVVHYAWTLEDPWAIAPALIAAARGVVALGWGVDLVVGDGAVVDAARLAELAAGLKTWRPRVDGRCSLRVPVAGTLADLRRRHQAFQARTSLADPTMRPPPALSTFAATRYARTDEPAVAEVASFTLMHVDSERLRAFDTVQRGMAVAGMLRHAVRTAAERAGWDAARVREVVLGHGSGPGPRLLLVPVPSIEPRGENAETVGSVRRAMLFSTDVGSPDTAWAARALGGMDLVDEATGEVQAVLVPAPRGDRVLARYETVANTWATVTPMVLPGHDDPGGLRARLGHTKDSTRQKLLLQRLMQRREDLVRKALCQAGLGDDLARTAEIEVREAGFFAGTAHAQRYAVARHLTTSPRFHVRLTWPREVAGPLCIGRGRFSGLGLFAALAA